jgi:hypothetical protein
MVVKESDTQLQILIDRVLAGDAAAYDALLDHACDRLLRLTRKMFRSQRFHHGRDLRRWEQTDDVFQNAMLRLHRALAEVKPESVRHFFNLAMLVIRRTLCDLVKHHLGPHGQGPTTTRTACLPTKRAGPFMIALIPQTSRPGGMVRIPCPSRGVA